MLFGVEVRVSIHIRLEEGTEAAAEIPNDLFQVLVRIVVWELAMRTSPEQFDGHVRNLAGFRARFEQDLAAARQGRDHKRFVASVLSDIEALPSQEARSEPTTGLYL